MIQPLVQYFIKNGHLDLPTIGILKWSRQSSHWEQDKFIAPKEFIVLELAEVSPNKHFYTFLSDELNISVEQANVQFENFIKQFTMLDIASLTFGNLGTLHKNGKEITWNNLYNGNAYYKDLTINLTTLYENDDNTSYVRKDYWLAWAIGLIFIAAALIFYKQF